MGKEFELFMHHAKATYAKLRLGLILTWHARYEPERTEDSECPEGLYIEAFYF